MDIDYDKMILDLRMEHLVKGYLHENKSKPFEHPLKVDLP